SWEQSRPEVLEKNWSIGKGLIVHYPLDGKLAGHVDGAQRGTVKGGELTFVPGRIGQAARFDGRQYVDAGDVAKFGFYDKFSWSAWVYPRGPDGGIILSRMTSAARTEEGYSFQLVDGKLQVNLIKRWLDDALRVETEGSLAPERWRH